MEFLVDLVWKISLYSVDVEWCWVLGTKFLFHCMVLGSIMISQESEMFHSEKHTIPWLLMAGVEFECGYHTVNNFDSQKLWQIWQITAICQVFFCQFSQFPYHCLCFTIICYPSTLGRLLGLPLVMP